MGVRWQHLALWALFILFMLALPEFVSKGTLRTIIFANFLAFTRVTQSVLELVSTTTLPPWAILLAMVGVLLVMGMLMDQLAILSLAMPLAFPAAMELGYDPVWFGILFAMNIQIYMLSPPFGPACFYLKSVAPKDVTLQEIFAAVLPFIGLQIIGLALVMAFPQIALWLPSLG